MTKLRIPRHFIIWLWKNGPTPSQEDLHLALLIQKVYLHIPACDRAVLREYVMTVSVVSGTDGDLLGSVGSVAPASIENGNVGDIAKENVDKDVTLNRDNLRGSDSACLYVIAHEFAHVVLRHNQMTLVLSSLHEFRGANPYKDKDYKQIYELHEDEADLQAWVWRFDKEFKECHQEFPKARTPRWFMDISSEL